MTAMLQFLRNSAKLFDPKVTDQNVTFQRNFTKQDAYIAGYNNGFAHCANKALKLHEEDEEG